jgi:AcrR family transcriptional regulator
MNGFERRKERIKKNIRYTALQLFMEHGFRKVNIKEIADKAGVSQVTIYNYFGSKNDLARNVLEYYMEDQLEEFIQLYKSPQPFLEKIEWVFHQKVKAFDTMSVEFLDSFISTDPEISEMIKQYEKKTIPLFAEFIKQGKEQGYFNKELSMETIMFYIKLFSGQAMQQLEKMPEGEQKRLVYKELVTVFFNGVMGKPVDDIQELLENSSETRKNT